MKGGKTSQAQQRQWRGPLGSSFLGFERLRIPGQRWESSFRRQAQQGSGYKQLCTAVQVDFLTTACLELEFNFLGALSGSMFAASEDPPKYPLIEPLWSLKADI